MNFKKSPSNHTAPKKQIALKASNKGDSRRKLGNWSEIGQEPKEIMVSEKDKGGRPDKVTTDLADQIFFLAGLGLTEDQIATGVGISREAITKAKKRDKRFLLTIEQMKEVADADVVKGLYKRAVGFEYEEEYYSEKSDAAVSVRKTVHPDVHAIRFWLKNRQRKKWRDVVNDELPDPNGQPINLSLTKLFIQARQDEIVGVKKGQDQFEILFGKEAIEAAKSHGTNDRTK